MFSFPRDNIQIQDDAENNATFGTDKIRTIRTKNTSPEMSSTTNSRLAKLRELNSKNILDKSFDSIVGESEEQSKYKLGSGENSLLVSVVGEQTFQTK